MKVFISWLKPIALIALKIGAAYYSNHRDDETRAIGQTVGEIVGKLEIRKKF